MHDQRCETVAIRENRQGVHHRHICPGPAVVRSLLVTELIHDTAEREDIGLGPIVYVGEADRFLANGKG